MKQSNLYWIYLCRFLSFLRLDMFFIFIYITEQGIGVENLALFPAIVSLATLLLEVPFGYFADKKGRKLTMLVAAVALVLSRYMFYVADSFASFMTAFALMGIYLAGFSGTDYAIGLSMLKTKEEKDHFFMQMEKLKNYAAVLGIVIGYILLRVVGMRFALLVNLLIGVMTFTSTFFVVDNSTGVAKDFRFADLRLFFSLKDIKMIVMTLFINGVILSLLAYDQNFLKYTLQLNMTWVSVYILGTYVASTLWSNVVKKHFYAMSARKVVMVSSLPLILQYGVMFVVDNPMLMLVMCISCLANTTLQITNVRAIAANIDNQVVASYLSIRSFISKVFTIILPLLYKGVIAAFGFRYVYLCGVILVAVSLIFTYRHEEECVS